MKPLKTLIEQHENLNAAAKKLGVHREQLKRLVDKGAYISDSGVVYIPSKTKFKAGLL